MTQKNIVEIEKLSFGYDNRMLHKDINMVFPRGKVTAIMGGSGCGKTTILRLIGVKSNLNLAMSKWTTRLFISKIG